MPILRHPTFDDITQDVPDADKDAWRAQGWKEENPNDATQETQTPAQPEPLRRRAVADKED